MTPQFNHRPMKGRLQAVFYGGGPQLEFFFSMPATREAAIERMKFEAEWYCRQHFMLRDGDGVVIYDSMIEQVAA